MSATRASVTWLAAAMTLVGSAAAAAGEPDLVLLGPAAGLR